MPGCSARSVSIASWRSSRNVGASVTHEVGFGLPGGSFAQLAETGGSVGGGAGVGVGVEIGGTGTVGPPPEPEPPPPPHTLRLVAARTTAPVRQMENPRRLILFSSPLLGARQTATQSFSRPWPGDGRTLSPVYCSVGGDAQRRVNASVGARDPVQNRWFLEYESARSSPTTLMQ